MEHEGVSTLTFQRVNDLCVPGRSERHSTNRLGLTTGEQCRAMCFSKDIHFAGNRTYGAIISPVDTGFASKDPTPNNLLLKAFEDILDVIFRRAVLGRQLRHDLVFNLTHALITLCFLSNAVCLTQRA